MKPRQDQQKRDRLEELLRISVTPVEVSRGFDVLFWKKVTQRQRVPWFQRVFGDLEFWLPTPGLAQGLAVLLVAFVIGGGSGLLLGGQEKARVFSGFDELKGVPSVSLTGAYLKTTQERSVR